MKKMIAAGDSFTYGEELEDLTNGWTYLVSKKLSLDLINLGVPGGSNYRAARLLMEQDLTDVELVCIGWSHYDRLEIADELGIYDTWPGGYRTKYRQEAPWRGQLIDYISRHHDDDFFYTHYLMKIVLIQAWLEKNNVRYVMMDAFGNHKDPRRTDPKFDMLLKQVNTNTFIGWPNESMAEWTKDLPSGPVGHFLDEGHRVIADRILKHLNIC